MIEVGDTIWHPCNSDIIEHKVVRIIDFNSRSKHGVEKTTHYVLQSERSVGKFNSIKVRVSITEVLGKLQFLELLDTEETSYTSGLWDFVEGNYYSDQEKAKLEFYQQQELLFLTELNRKKQLYDQAKANYRKVKLLIEQIKK